MPLGGDEVITRHLWLKLLVSIVGSLALILGFFGYQIIQLQKEQLEAATLSAADRISDSIKKGILYGMQRNDREQIYHTIKTIGLEPGINKVRIFNKVGRISFSSDDAEIDTFVDKQAEACYACHKEEEPLSRLDQPERRRVYRDASGNRILGLINAIENEPQCYTAECHAHTEDQQVLGVLDVTMSLSQADDHIRTATGLVIGELALSMISVSAVLGGLVLVFVRRPIRALIVGTEKVASGDLGHRISVRTRDEIGVLGDSFNRMTTQLQQAREELTNWARTLEIRVDEKTAELQRAHETMMQVERMASMGKLAAIVAHEINNPLAGILTSARLVAKRLNGLPNQDDNLEHVQMIGEEAARCGEIVKNLLQFARTRSELQQAEDLNKIVEDSLRLVRHKINLLSVETQLDLDPRMPPVVCESQSVRQALLAILINACEAVGDTGGVIEVATRYHPDREEAEIQIRDDGCGMDEETRRRIFEPFFTTKDAVRGVGLGLAVVSGIVSAHGGQIRVDSTPGVGTTFHVLLPVNAPRPGTERKILGDHNHD